MSDTPKHYWEYGQQDKTTREKYGIGDILENAAECLKCGDYIRSNNRHDYRSCSCGAISVDGGSWYAKRSGNYSDCRDKIVLFDDAKNTE